MITFTPYASSSAGNLYLCTAAEATGGLLLECGLRWRDIARHLRSALPDIQACLLTHNHMDHAKSAREVLRRGIDLYCSKGTADALGLSGHRLHILTAGKQVKIGEWVVYPFQTEHDAPEPLGFFIANRSDRLLFLTDSYFIKPRFKGITHLAIECNWSEKTLSKDLHPTQERRLRESHMSLETLLQFLDANDLTDMQEIHLLHLSRENSDEGYFRQSIQRKTGVPVYVAGA